MVWYSLFKPICAGIDFSRQNLTIRCPEIKDKILIMAVDPYLKRYLNESEKAD